MLSYVSFLVMERSRGLHYSEMADCDHNPVICAILASIPQTSTFIQLSGAASIYSNINGIGQLDPRVWSDIDDLQEITSFDTSHSHATTDQLVLSEGKKRGVRTAIVVPPNVVGTGEGPLRKTSKTLPWTVAAIMKRGKGFIVGKGEQVISTVHVRDLSDAILFLVEEALVHEGGKANWGEKGWYYVESGSYMYVDLLKRIIGEMARRELIESSHVDELTADEAKGINPYAELIWGSNMRINGERIRSLGWTAKEPDAFLTIPELLS